MDFNEGPFKWTGLPDEVWKVDKFKEIEEYAANNKMMKSLFGVKASDMNYATTRHQLVVQNIGRYVESVMNRDIQRVTISYNPMSMTYVVNYLTQIEGLREYTKLAYTVPEHDLNISAEYTEKVLQHMTYEFKKMLVDEEMKLRCIDDNPQDLICEYDEDDVGAYVPWI